jgi:excisionase family DNA binding protein
MHADQGESVLCATAEAPRRTETSSSMDAGRLHCSKGKSVAAEDKRGSLGVSTKAFPPLCETSYGSWNVALSFGRPRRIRPDIQPKVLKTRDAAAYLGVSRWTLRNFVHNGRLAYLPGKHWRFSTEDLDECIRRNREKETVI